MKLLCTAVSWNIHRGRGADGQVDPVRTLRALEQEVCPRKDLDILALQEADEETPPHAGILDPEAVQHVTGLVHAQTNPRHRWSEHSHGFLGTVLFLRADWSVHHVDMIDLPGHCHRGAVALEVDRGGSALRIISTHLSLWQPLRLVQMRTLGQYIFRQ